MQLVGYCRFPCKQNNIMSTVSFLVDNSLSTGPDRRLMAAIYGIFHHEQLGSKQRGSCNSGCRQLHSSTLTMMTRFFHLCKRGVTSSPRYHLQHQWTSAETNNKRKKHLVHTQHSDRVRPLCDGPPSLSPGHNRERKSAAVFWRPGRYRKSILNSCSANAQRANLALLGLASVRYDKGL
jgi:hypothetical protein